ncbi:MAG: hypothetical protein ACRDQU_02520 [Pseudonocardiaceae bacterium]
MNRTVAVAEWVGAGSLLVLVPAVIGWLLGGVRAGRSGYGAM